MLFAILTFCLMFYCMFKGIRTKRRIFVFAILSLSMPWAAAWMMMNLFSGSAFTLLIGVSLAAYFLLTAAVVAICLCVDVCKFLYLRFKKNAILSSEEAQ